MLPCWIFPFDGRRPRRDAARVVFPDPDSPSTPRISPDLTSKLTSTITEEGTLARDKYATRRFRTSRTDSKSPALIGKCLDKAIQSRFRLARKSEGVTAQLSSGRKRLIALISCLPTSDF